MTIIWRGSRGRPAWQSDPYLTDTPDDSLPYRKPKFEPHDPQTRVLMQQYEELARLPHGEVLAERLETWRWLDSMASPEEKQRFLEPLINAVRRDPEANQDKLVFLLIVCEPVRRKVSKEFVRAREGLDRTPPEAPTRHQRVEARWVRNLDLQRLWDVTRSAVLEALFRYPTPSPDRFFPWLRRTVSYRALDHLLSELPEIETTQKTAAEAAAIQDYLAGFENVDPPPMRDAAGFRAWQSRADMRVVYDVTDDYYAFGTVRKVCADAIGRLPDGQRDVIRAYFFAGDSVDEIAARRRVSESTIYNTKSQAQRKLHDDECFFVALYNLGKVRDRARAKYIVERYPEGRLPDGRRVVVIDQAA